MTLNPTKQPLLSTARLAGVTYQLHRCSSLSPLAFEEQLRYKGPMSHPTVQEQIRDTGEIQGFLVVEYLSKTKYIEHEFDTHQEVRSLVRENSQRLKPRGFEFFTLIHSNLGIEMLEGCTSSFMKGMPVYRQVCVCQAHTWKKLTDYSYLEARYLCIDCLRSTNRSLVS